MKKSLKEIYNDKISGSEDILEKINLFVINNLDSNKKILKLIAGGRDQLSSFQAVQTYLNKIEKFLKDYKKEELWIFVKNFTEKKQKIFEIIFKKLWPEIRELNSVFTFSNSKTVYEILKLWSNENPDLKIYISESRPKKEGRILAKKLLKENYRIIFVTEAQSAHIIEKVDCVLIGADKILPNGKVINKIGSKNLAIISKFFNKPFFVICSKDKFAETEEFKLEEEKTSEIWKYKNKNLNISNFYFEEIEKELISKIITD
jgi:translation initiation factor 2B subunit (eIF-2B alpha/beta/delta family)